MFQRVIIYLCFAILIVSFGFILLAVLNADSDGEIVRILEQDAQVIFVLSLIGLFATMVIAIRMMVDSRYRRDLEHRASVPRRKSDVSAHDTDSS